LAASKLEWRPARLPTTVAQALGIRVEAGADHRNLEDSDYWFRTRFGALVARIQRSSDPERRLDRRRARAQRRQHVRSLRLHRGRAAGAAGRARHSLQEPERRSPQAAGPSALAN